MNSYLDLFLTFAKVGVCTFGGGMAMLPILQREIVENKHWATDAELNDYYAIGQCTPGIIAVNTATFIGSKQEGIAGGIIATLGLVFPSVIIIVLIASVLTNFAEYAVVQHAFSGIRACVCVLIFNSVLKLRKSSVIDRKTSIIFWLVLLLASVDNFMELPGVLQTLFSPAVLVILAGLCGLWAKGGNSK